MLKLCARAPRMAPCLIHFRNYPMRFFAFSVAVSCLAAAPSLAAAQSTNAPAPAVGSTLSIAEAIAIAKRSNPGYQTTLDTRKTAANAVRVANGNFLPSLNSSFGGGYREGRQQLVNGQPFGTTNATLSSSGGIGIQYSIAPGDFSERKARIAEQSATEADIGGAEQNLRVNVTSQYIAVLQAQANALLQDTLLATTNAQLELARAKLQVGTGIQLDVDQADVAHGQQRVAALRAHNDVDIAKIALFQQMGVAPNLGTVLQPLTAMDMPSMSLQQILDMAKQSNPVIESGRAREKAAGFSLTTQRRSYLPSLSMSSDYSGFAQRFTNTQQLIDIEKAGVPLALASCQRSEEVRKALNLSNRYDQCATLTAFDPASEAAIRDAQSKYPFGFTRNPYGLNVSISLPLFNGFVRETNIQNAEIRRNNARNAVREQEIKINADVNTAWLTLTTSQQTVAIQDQNARTARSALALAQERYRVGSISLVDLVQARSNFDRAESDRIAAIYNFQRAFVQLEAAVGRPLR